MSGAHRQCHLASIHQPVQAAHVLGVDIHEYLVCNAKRTQCEDDLAIDVNRQAAAVRADLEATCIALKLDHGWAETDERAWRHVWPVYRTSALCMLRLLFMNS